MALTPRDRDRPTLVVLRALGLGDLLAGVPALRAIARAFPDHERVLATPAALGPLVGVLEHAWTIADARGLGPLPAAIRRPEIAVNLHGRGPQSHQLLLRLRPRRLVAFRHRSVPESAGEPRWRPREHEVARWCRLLTESGIAADPSELAIAPADRRIDPELRGATVIHPGAASPARRWPPERWAAVARAEREQGRTVAITGTLAERPLGNAIADLAGLPPGASLAGRTDVAELTALVAAAARVVCGDTGVAHLATALGTPSVVLFGPTSPREWGPPPADRRHVALWAGERGDPHGQRVDPGLLAIGVSDVLGALSELPARRRARSRDPAPAALAR